MLNKPARHAAAKETIQYTEAWVMIPIFTILEMVSIPSLSEEGQIKLFWAKGYHATICHLKSWEMIYAF